VWALWRRWPVDHFDVAAFRLDLFTPVDRSTAALALFLIRAALPSQRPGPAGSATCSPARNCLEVENGS